MPATHNAEKDGHRIPHADHDARAESALLLLKRLAAAVQTCRLYGAAHARTEIAVSGLGAVVARAARTNGTLTLHVSRAAWRLSSEEAERPAGPVTPLLQALYGRGVRAVSFAAGVTDAELRTFIVLVDLPIERVRAAGGAAGVLRQGNVRRITVREVKPAAATGTDPALVAAPYTAVAPETAERILKQFVAAARSVRLYGEPHRTVQAAIDDLFRSIERALAAAGTLCYEVRSGAVVAGGAALDDDGGVAATFAVDCAARRIDRLSFAAGLTRAELTQAVALFAREPEALIVEGGFGEALRARQVAHVG